MSSKKFRLHLYRDIQRQQLDNNSLASPCHRWTVTQLCVWHRTVLYRSGSASCMILVRSDRETSTGSKHCYPGQGKGFSPYFTGLYTFSHLFACIQCWSSCWGLYLYKWWDILCLTKSTSSRIRNGRKDYFSQVYWAWGGRYCGAFSYSVRKQGWLGFF
jgi:hypothetical protein